MGSVQIQTPGGQGTQDDQDQLDRDREPAPLGDDHLELELVGQQDEEADAGDADGDVVRLGYPLEDLDVALSM